MNKLSTTQSAVLAALLDHRAEGEKRLPAKEAAAFGGLGLTNRERLITIGIYPSGSWFGSRTVKGGSIRTLYALLNLDLVRCNEGIWFATVPRERLCVPMNADQAARLI
jgi:hypothetical protein